MESTAPFPVPQLLMEATVPKKCSCSSASCHHVYGCNVTEDCPVGYNGDNCSLSCPAPTDGNSCAETCSCSNASCQYVHGCNLTTECRDECDGQQNCSKRIFQTYQGTPCQVYDCSNSSSRSTGCSNNAYTTNTIPERDMEKRTNVQQSERFSNRFIMEKMFWTVLSITLMLLIAREIFKVVRKSETIGNYHVAMVTPVVYNASDDTSEFIYNS
nr:protein draper-like isoform X2 [Crassostrea virginica]